MRYRKILSELVIVLSILTVGSIIFRLSDLDLGIQRLFYRAGSGWYLKDYFLFRFLYHYGNIPGILLFVGAIIILIYGHYNPKCAVYRKICFFYIIAMLIGPGLIVNAIFKDYWGRSRPREIIEFGGRLEFLPLWVKGMSGSSESFPCGHASMGFLFLALFFIWRKEKPKYAVTAFILSMLYGLLMGLARIAQGGHFASDVLWTAGFIYLTCMLFYYLLNLDKNIYWSKEAATQIAKPVRIALLTLIPLAIYFLLLATPYYRERNIKIDLPETDHHHLTLYVEQGLVEISTADSLYLSYTSQGFGFPSSKVNHYSHTNVSNDTTFTSIVIDNKGVFTELITNVTLFIPKDDFTQVEVEIEKGTFYLSGQLESEELFSPHLSPTDILDPSTAVRSLVLSDKRLRVSSPQFDFRAD